MADTLIREVTAYGSQPLSPVPQYWDGAGAYAKAQGINGAIRVINYTSAGETFTGSSPASVQLTATSTVAISGTATVNFSGSGTVVISGTATVNFSGNGTVAVVSSAGGTAYFSATNPGYVTSVIANQQTVYSGSATWTSGSTATASQTFSVGALTANTTTLVHEVFITNNGPYPITADIFKVISAGDTTNVDIGVNFTVPASVTSAGVTVGGYGTQVRGLFNVDLGLVVRLTVTAAFTAAVTSYVLIKELDA